MKTIIYDLQGGEMPEGVELVTECTFTSRRVLPSPLRGEDKFIGWFNEGGERVLTIHPRTTPDGITLTARYKEAPKPKKERGRDVVESKAKLEEIPKEESQPEVL